MSSALNLESECPPHKRPKQGTSPNELTLLHKCLVVKHWLNDVDFQYIRGFIYGCLPQEAFVLVTTGLAKLSDVVKNEPATYIFGPKGVGKSYSLIYLACLAEVTVVISPQKPICDVVQYLTHLETQHLGTNRVNDAVHPSYEQVETKLKKLSDKLKEGIMILIDIGTLSWSKENRAYLKHVSQILINCYESKIVIAVTSGDGMCAKLDDTDWLQIKNLTSHYAAHELLNFSEAEATLYLEERKKYKDVGIDTENMKTIKRLTCYNPYLLNLLSHHGLMYRSRFYALSHDYIRRHVNSIFMDLKVFSELQAFCRDHMDSLYHWGYKADNEIPTDLAQLRQFINSWGAKQYILYEQINKEHFFVINALPCLNLLLQEVTHRITEGQESIPDVPSVKGFAYEEKYFKQFVGGSVSLVGRNETTTVRATVAGVLNQEVINENLVVGSLYHVKFTYPVIDGVGCLRVDGSHALVFVQVSRSKYVEHSTKSSHLENPAPENPAVSILDHCRQKAPPDISRIIYLYVSPHSSFKGKPNERTAIAAKQARGTGAAQTIVRTGAVAKGKQKGDRIMQKTVGKMQKTDGIMTRSKHAELQVARSLQVEYFEHQFF